MQIPNSPFTATGSASNSLPTLKLVPFVGPSSRRKRVRELHEVLETEADSRFDAHFSKKWTEHWGNCAEAIGRTRSGRCIRPHEGRRRVSLCKAGSAPLTSCATSLDAGAAGNPSWGVLRLSEHVTLCPFRLKSHRHVQAMLRNHNRRCTARRLEHYSSLREPVLDFRNSPDHFTIVRLIDVQDQCDLVL